jgi:predicted acyl esterase
VRYALGRLPGLLHPPVDVYEPDSGSLTMLRDLAVTVRDGTTLRVNVVLPAGQGPFPVLLSAHPYGKDNLPRRHRTGYRVSVQYRMLRQPGRVRFSSLTGWEAPDPAWWAAQGYAVANCDLRGAGTSEGTCAIWSDQEGEDVHDLIEWAGAQPWSTGAVGMLGVSYLAISQWKAAALAPPSLKAICPWEGFTDAYRDLASPGGIREDGFWATAPLMPRISATGLPRSSVSSVVGRARTDLAGNLVQGTLCGEPTAWPASLSSPSAASAIPTTRWTGAYERDSAH